MIHFHYAKGRGAFAAVHGVAFILAKQNTRMNICFTLNGAVFVHRCQMTTYGSSCTHMQTGPEAAALPCRTICILTTSVTAVNASILAYMVFALVSHCREPANLETYLIGTHADTEMKRRAIEKVSSNIGNVGTDATVPDSFDDNTLKRLYGLR